MQKQQLLELRSKIVQSAQEIALRGEGSPADRLQILLGIVRDGNANIEVLTKAYELTQSIESDDEKLTALLDVLYEVDAKLVTEEGEGATNQAQQQPEAQQNEQQ